MAPKWDAEGGGCGDEGREPSQGTEVSTGDAVQVQRKVASCNPCKAPNTTGMKAHFDGCHANLEEGPPHEGSDVIPQGEVAVPPMVLLIEIHSHMVSCTAPSSRGLLFGEGRVWENSFRMRACFGPLPTIEKQCERFLTDFTKDVKWNIYLCKFFTFFS